MFCGIGRNKDGDCKKPPKSPIVFGEQNNDKNPSVSPITTKTGPIKRSSVSPIQTQTQTPPPEISDKTFEEAVELLDIEAEEPSRVLADKYGLVAPGKLPGRAYRLEQLGHPAYTYPKSNRRARHTQSNKSKKKGGLYKKRKTRRRKRKRRKTRKKRKRKKRRRKTRRN